MGEGEGQGHGTAGRVRERGAPDATRAPPLAGQRDSRDHCGALASTWPRHSGMTIRGSLRVRAPVCAVAHCVLSALCRALRWGKTSYTPDEGLLWPIHVQMATHLTH